MTFARFAAAAALFLTLAACAYMAPVQPRSTFYVMRHLNTPAGATDPDLTEEGRRNAELLVSALATPPAAIFVTDTKRARQTAAPLAARLGIEPIVYDPSNTALLVSEVMKEPPPVLIIGHSNTVPEIVAALSGGQRPGPLTHEDFGDIWQIAGRSVTRTKLGGS